jgi:outer membrane protein TolC
MNMRYLLIFTLLFALIGKQEVLAQKVNWDHIILPPDSLTDNVEEKLVQIAWANFPQNQSKYADIAISKSKLQYAKFSFLENFGAGVQINSQAGQPATNSIGGPGGTIQQVTTTTSLPRFGFGIQFGIGQVLTTPFKVKTAKEELRKAEHELNLQKMLVRKEVITRYNTYKAAYEVLRHYAGIIEEVKTSHSVAVKNFENGTIALDVYQQSLGLLNQNEERLIAAKYNLKITKANLEELLGAKLEEIIQQ